MPDRQEENKNALDNYSGTYGFMASRIYRQCRRWFNTSAAGHRSDCVGLPTAFGTPCEPVKISPEQHTEI